MSENKEKNIVIIFSIFIFSCHMICIYVIQCFLNEVNLSFMDKNQLVVVASALFLTGGCGS